MSRHPHFQFVCIKYVVCIIIKILRTDGEETVRRSADVALVVLLTSLLWLPLCINIVILHIIVLVILVVFVIIVFCVCCCYICCIYGI